MFFKESNVARYKYDFVLLTDLSMLQKSKAGKELLEKKVLPYYNEKISPTKRKKKLKKGGLINYISSQIESSFNVNLLRALGLLDTCEDLPDTKEKYVNTLVKKLYTYDFIPKHANMLTISNKFQTKDEIILHGGYLYDAFGRIIQERKFIQK